MKKHLRFMIAAVLTFALVGMFALAGCSSSATEESTAESSSSATASTEESSSEAAEAVELQIFAANSLSEAMDKVQELYSETHEGVTFADTQYEASGTLNEMLAAGSYADILITASKGTMDTAVEEAYVDEGTRFDMFTNDLVIVAGENSDITEVTLDDVATGQYTVAVGDDNVPAGNYAKQALSTVGCWVDEEGTTGSESDGKGGTFDGTPLAGLVTEGSSVGNVCSYANSGDVDLAFVYTSDVYRFGGVKIVGTVPSDTHKNIIYPAAVCADSENAEAAAAFLDWCTTDEEALKIWQEWGFELA
ncbi:MAG TPA: extracellular solute-binding protein [Candidatus Aveggerthella stercoripullorum]|uniref:Extracellular solute-binding protein n=1 Tax=Candidatus Aveggerthella stercoripullorum TaxID=2840688 RepID=A0A9D0ZYV9_9ACTN|nr:extracellular solute-binding protein [Candidatus Aveggerthella stercoripullorum]